MSTVVPAQPNRLRGIQRLGVGQHMVDKKNVKWLMTQADTKQVKCKSPLKIAEYLASGKAIVASNIGEIPWMLGNAGVLTNPDDVDDLSKGIMMLLKDEKKRKELEILARKRAEKMFHWKTAADKLEEIYIKNLKHEKRYK